MKSSRPGFTIIAVGAVSAIAQSCAPRQPAITVESIKPIIETAFKNYMAESSARAIRVLADRAQALAVKEIERLNAAELLYKDEVHEVILPGPMAYGWFVKQYRHYHSHVPVDIVEDPSVFVSYRVYIGYQFNVLETERHHNRLEKDARSKAKNETEFHESNAEGTLVISYAFNNDLQWDGRKGKYLGTTGVGLERQLLAAGEEKRYDPHWITWDKLKMR